MTREFIETIDKHQAFLFKLLEEAVQECKNKSEEIEKLNNLINEIQEIIDIEKRNMNYAIYDSCLLSIEEKIKKINNI